MLTLEGVVIIIGWITSLTVAVVIVPRIAAKRVCEQFGLTLVNQGDRRFFVPTDPNDGSPIKVPIGVKTAQDGSQEVVMGYAPLAYTMPVLAAEYAATKIKMTLLNAKGQVSKKISAEALKAGLTDELMPFLPKKLQGALAIARALGLGGDSSNGTAQGQTQGRAGSGTFSPGMLERKW